MKTGSLQRYGRTLAPEFDLAFQKSLGLGHFPIPMPALFLLEATAGINTAAAGPAARLNSRRFNGGLRRILGVSEQSGERPVTTQLSRSRLVSRRAGFGGKRANPSARAESA